MIALSCDTGQIGAMLRKESRALEGLNMRIDRDTRIAGYIASHVTSSCCAYKVLLGVRNAVNVNRKLRVHVQPESVFNFAGIRRPI